MKVILLTELKGKGGEGDVVDVAPGYANNYLYPKKIAIPATKGNLKQLEQRKHNIAAREEARLEKAEALKSSLSGLTVKVQARVGDEGVLFGSVTSQMIAEALNELGYEIDRRYIDLTNPIKTAGEHEVIVSIYREIKTPLKILVGDEEALAEAEAEEDTTTSDAVAEETPEAEVTVVEETEEVVVAEVADAPETEE